MFSVSSHHFDNFSGATSGVMLWAAGVVTNSLVLQYGGFAVGIGMFALGISKEIREWRRPTKGKP